MTDSACNVSPQGWRTPTLDEKKVIERLDTTGDLYKIGPSGHLQKELSVEDRAAFLAVLKELDDMAYKPEQAAEVAYKMFGL